MSQLLNLDSVDNGVLLRVRVIPRASRNEIDGVRDGALRVRLKAPPVDGAANKALCTLLARILSVSKRQVEIITGERSRSKTVAISGVSPTEATQALTGSAK